MRGAAAQIIGAALLIMPSLGALYTWSVLAGPLEQRLGLERSQTSLVFSLATVGFTAGMFLAPRLYGRVSVPVLSLLAMAMAAAGLALAGLAPAYWTLLVGFGGLFGLANGLGYSVTLQAVHAAIDRRRGIVTGVIVAAYGAGAAIFAPLIAWGVAAFAVDTALAAAAAFMLLIGIAAAALQRRAGATISPPAHLLRSGGARDGAFIWLWLGFLAGSASGVMALGHAATIAAAYGADAGALVTATVLVAVGNGAGRLAGGWLGDIMAPRRALMATQLLLGGALLLPLAAPHLPSVLAALLLAGIGYGATASLYPIAVSVYYGAAQVGRIYGRLFTAWGIAGLGAPWLAGLLFDWTGGYTLAIALGVAAAAAAAFTSFRLPPGQAAPEARTTGRR